LVSLFFIYFYPKGIVQKGAINLEVFGRDDALVYFERCSTKVASLDDLQYIEITDFFLVTEHQFFFITREFFWKFQFFFHCHWFLRPTDPENNLVEVDLKRFFSRF